jgi:hypothetical protein
MALWPTCLGAALLLAFATWLLLIESDDDGESRTDDPDWWPEFERELGIWSRRLKVPAGPRT